MTGKLRRVFWIGLTLTTLSNIYHGFSAFFPLFLIRRGMASGNMGFYMDLFTLVGFGVTLGTVMVGYRFTRKADIEKEHMQIIKDLGLGWIVSTILVLPVFLSSDEMWRSLAQVTLMRSATSGYVTGAILFSGMVLGWIIEDRFVISRELNMVILKPLVVYHGVKFIERFIMTTLISNSMYGGLNIREIGTYSFIMGLLIYPIWLWYLKRMLSSGKKIDLAEEYGSVLFTLWAASAARMSLSYISNAVLWQSFSGLADLPEFIINYAIKLAESTVSVFGLAFALICFGYISSLRRPRVLNS